MNPGYIDCITGGVIAALMIGGALCWTFWRGYRAGYDAALETRNADFQ